MLRTADFYERRVTLAVARIRACIVLQVAINTLLLVQRRDGMAEHRRSNALALLAAAGCIERLRAVYAGGQTQKERRQPQA